jgi:hypothetical protein
MGADSCMAALPDSTRCKTAVLRGVACEDCCAASA